MSRLTMRRERNRLSTYLTVAVCVPGFLSQPVNGVEVLVCAHIGERLIQEVHQVPGTIHLLRGRGGTHTWKKVRTSSVLI